MITILYCAECGWRSRPNVGMVGKCPICYKKGLLWTKWTEEEHKKEEENGE